MTGLPTIEILSFQFAILNSIKLLILNLFQRGARGRDFRQILGDAGLAGFVKIKG